MFRGQLAGRFTHPMLTAEELVALAREYVADILAGDVWGKGCGCVW